jgi:hypothetical protein
MSPDLHKSAVQALAQLFASSDKALQKSLLDTLEARKGHT